MSELNLDKLKKGMYEQLLALVDGEAFTLKEKDEQGDKVINEVTIKMTEVMGNNVAKLLYAVKTGKEALEVESEYEKMAQTEKYDYLVLAYGILAAYSGVLYKDFPSQGGMKDQFLQHMGVIKNSDPKTSKYTEEDSYCAGVFLTEGFHFGYTGVISILNDVLVSNSNEVMSLKNLTAVIENGTNCELRVCDKEKYFADYFYKDMVLLYVLLNPIYRDFEGTEFIKYLDSTVEIHRMAGEWKAKILANLKLLYQDGLGLHPYTGMLSRYEGQTSKAGKKVEKERSAYVLQVNPNSGALQLYVMASDTIKGAVKNMVGTHDAALIYGKECTARQFDLIEIRDSAVPLYYPNKLLEFATGRVLTKYNDKYTYEPFVNSLTWEEYEEGYVQKQVEDTLLRMAECVILKYVGNFAQFITGVLGQKGNIDKYAKIESFDDPYFSFIGVNSDPRKLALDQFVKSDDISDAIYNAYIRLYWAYSIGAVMTKFDCIGEELLEVRLRLSSPCRKLSTKDTNKIILRTDSIKDGYDLGSSTGCSMVEYQHSYNPEITDSVPTWGYKAVELYKKRKQKLSWDKILLGADEKATPIFAEKYNGGKTSPLYFQDKLVHNMMAGTRAGKGVMTMNILVSAAASRKPIFYIDRKPDMASVYYQLTEGNMCIVNGGQYDYSKDLGQTPEEKKLGKNGAFGQAWEQARMNIPQDIQDTFGITADPSLESNSFIGDMAYFRALMLMWGILYARARSDKAKKSLGGSEGVIFVVDEFTNWEKNFGDTYLSVSGGNSFPTLAYNTSTESKAQSIQRKIDNDQKTVSRLEKNKDTLAENNKSTSTVEGKIDSTTAKIEESEFILNTQITPLSIFCRMYVDTINLSFSSLATARRAAFNNGENRQSDIFVIGQVVYPPIATDTPYTPTTSGYNRNAEYKGSTFRYLFNTMPQNWFMGNNTAEQYCGLGGDKDVEKKFAKMWWYFVPSATIATVTDKKKLPSGGKWFKPNLVLNNNLEPCNSADESNSDETFVKQCMERVTDGLWDKARNGWLDPAREEEQNKNGKIGYLHEGIGLRGLIELVMSTSSTEVFEPTKALGKSKDIADSVARAMGYSNYIELIYDFSLEGVFGVDDVLTCIEKAADNNGIGEKKFKSHEFLDKYRDRLNMLTEEVETEESDHQDLLDAYKNSVEYQQELAQKEKEEKAREDELAGIGIDTTKIKTKEDFNKTEPNDLNRMFGSATPTTFDTSELEGTYKAGTEEDTEPQLSGEDLELLYRAKIRDVLLDSNPNRAEAMYNAIVGNTILWKLVVKAMQEADRGGN